MRESERKGGGFKILSGKTSDVACVCLSLDSSDASFAAVNFAAVNFAFITVYLDLYSTPV